MSKPQKVDLKGFDLPVVPKRTPVSEEEATEFIKGNSVTKQGLATVTRLHRSKKNSRLRGDKRGERVAVYIPPAMAEEMRIRCAKERRSLSHAATEVFGKWLKG